MMRLKLSKNYKRGMSLVEALVAIVILVVGVLGPLSLATRGITDGLFSNNKLVATFLAQEGLDLLAGQIIANQSDSSNPDWLDGLGDCQNSDGCNIDPLTFNNIYSCDESDPTDCQLAFNTDTSFYEPISGAGTFSRPVFTRILRVTPTADFPVTGESREVILTADLTWFDETNPKSLQLSQRLYD